MIICNGCNKGLKVHKNDARANFSGIHAKFTDQKISVSIALVSLVLNSGKSLKLLSFHKFY